MPPSWGGVARRGAGAATGKRVAGASRAWRDAVESSERGRPAPPPARPPAGETTGRAAEELPAWELVEEVRDEAEGAVARGAAPVPGGRPGRLDLADEVRQELSRAVGTARTSRVERRLGEAAEAFEAERFGDAARILKKLSDEAPTVAAVRELYGLTLYRQGKWKAAAKELEAYRLLADTVDQNPVLADCYRALRQWDLVDELWEELRAASPGADLVTEGRIVAAGSLADRDELVAAIGVLEQGWRFPKRPMTHHLRRAYALADLYERAGELPRARDLFARVRAADPGFADVDARLRALG